MTRILFWCDAFWPLIGGVEVLAAKLVVALKQRGYAFVVVTNRHPDLPARSDYHGIPVYRLPFGQAVVSGNVDEWAAVKQEVAAIKKNFRADIVHVYHVNVDVMFHLMTHAAHPAPTLCTVHGAFMGETMSPATAMGRVVRSSDWLTACSAAALDDTRRLAPEITPRSSMIWNGLAMPEISPAPLPFDEPVLLCAGRIATIDEKGFDLAMEAMRSLVKRYPKARLRIAGDGAARAGLERHAATLGIAGSVDFMGFVHPDRVPALMNEATMILMPSRVAEGFGLVALQAAQMGRPVVATRVGGVAEVVAHGETGLLVEPENAPSLVRAIESLLDDPVRAGRMGRAARGRAELLFGWERYVDAYDELLRRLVRDASVARREMTTA